MAWRWRACPLAAKYKACSRCRFLLSGSLCMRRCNSSALSTIVGIAFLMPLLLRLIGIEEHNTDCITANRKPYYLLFNPLPRWTPDEVPRSSIVDGSLAGEHFHGFEFGGITTRDIFVHLAALLVDVVD